MAKLIFLSLLLMSFYVSMNCLPFEENDILEGDILVKKKLSRSFGLHSDGPLLWPNGIVPYEISSSAGYTDSQKNLIKSGMDLITSKTNGCIQFEPKNSSHTGWINIMSGTGCSSRLGRWGSAQKVDLFKGECLFKGTIVHELMHTLGFFHEQTRPDRDQYITVHLENVDADKQDNFIKQTNPYYKLFTTFNTEYDLKSIMQSSSKWFSNNGEDTMVPKNGEILIPMYSKTDAQILSDSDIIAIKDLYNCPSPTLPPSLTGFFKFRLVNDSEKNVKLYLRITPFEVVLKTLKPGQDIELSLLVGTKLAVRGSDIKNTNFALGKGKFIEKGMEIKASEF